MRIGIISDTHENLEHISKAISFFNEQQVEIVFHAGDIISPITYSEFKKLQAQFVAVFGNNDGERFHLRQSFSSLGNIYEDAYEARIDGVRMVMYHKPVFHNAIIASGMYDLIVYGHTHEVDLRSGDHAFTPEKRADVIQEFTCNAFPVVINPGECCSMLTGMSSAVVFDTQTKKIFFKYVYKNPAFHR